LFAPSFYERSVEYIDSTSCSLFISGLVSFSSLFARSKELGYNERLKITSG